MKKRMLPVYVAVVALALAFALPVLADDDDDNTVKHIEIGDEGVTITDEGGDTIDIGDTLTLYDALGRKVRELASGHKAAGRYEEVVEMGDLPSGV